MTQSVRRRFALHRGAARAEAVSKSLTNRDARLLESFSLVVAVGVKVEAQRHKARHWLDRFLMLYGLFKKRTEAQ